MATANTSDVTWSRAEKSLFRFAFLYLVIQIVPVQPEFYRQLFSINRLPPDYAVLFRLVRYMPDFTGDGDSLINWVIAAALALAGAVLWTTFDTKTKSYDTWYYGLRVLVRYRLAASLLVYGFIKFYPLQAPEVSISNLNTAYGDFSAWKLFAMSLGIVPGYESFLGLIEITAALLLLHRRTVTIAALIIIPFTGNVFFSNLAYEGGEAVYSLFLLVLAGFLLFFDARRLYSLIAQEQPTFPNTFRPVFRRQWEKYGRVTLKAVFIGVFVFSYGIQARAAFLNDPYQYPRTPGLSGAAGLYNVKEFRINGKALPYSAVDPVRWRDVVFENWATISIRSNRSVVPDSTNTEQIHKADTARVYEFAGSTGRHYYSYVADTVRNELILTNRNKHYAGETLRLAYSRPDSATFTLQGLDGNRDSLYVVLEKINKKYLFEEVRKVGRRGQLKL